MKKWLILLLVLLLCPALAEDAPQPPALTLAGNPTTGYSWQVGTDAPEVVSVRSEYRPCAADEGLLGSGGVYEVYFIGLTPGEATVTCTYLRPWETNAPLYTLVYRVRVDEDLTVTILSSSFDW